MTREVFDGQAKKKEIFRGIQTRRGGVERFYNRKRRHGSAAGRALSIIRNPFLTNPFTKSGENPLSLDSWKNKKNPAESGVF